MKTHIQGIIEIKATIIEVAKDTPLVAYMAFYEPLHNWMNATAEGWNSSAKFLLNVVMVIYGLLRIVAILKNWGDTKPEQDNEGHPA